MVNYAYVLRCVRTDEGKRKRKDYELHKICHGFNEYRKLEPRFDGICNTLTSVLKDNLVLVRMNETSK